MKTTYKEGKNIDFDKIMQLYLDAEWFAYTQDPQTLKRAFEGSLFVLSAWQDDNLLGLVRVVGDGQTIIYIQDILVLKAYQRKGIGKNLLQKILDQYSNVRQKILLTDDTIKTRKFYESLDFQSCDDGKIIAFAKFG